MKQITAILLVLLMTLSFSSCKTNPQPDNGVISDTPITETPKSTSKDLMSGITPKTSLPDTVVNGVALTDFAVDLFKACDTADENVLVSPLSVMAALAMTANGAEGETLSQMESVLGMTKSELNENFAKYMKLLPSGEKYKLNLANAIWFTDAESFTVNQDFLQTNADYYGADIYKAPFDDTTLSDINNWVKTKTDEMIPEILDEISYEAVMYLVNALAFEAEWQEIYSEWDIREGYFSTSTGAPRTVDFMHSDEYTYLEDDNATGFVKYYADKKYAFAALLPNEGVKISDYVSTLDGATVNKILSNAASTEVSTFIPKFETEYFVEMSDVLEAMGMPHAFNSSDADFSSLGTSSVGNIYIDRVLHKTYISVDEKGTMAGASTVVEMVPESAVMEEPKIVRLDRPFVYMLIDCETNTPFFIGKVADIK